MREQSVYKSASLSDAEVASVIEFAETVDATEATVKSGEVGKQSVNKDRRISTIRWFKPSVHTEIEWLFTRMRWIVESLNDKYFGFDIHRGQHIDFQYTEYFEGGFFSRHSDTFFRNDKFRDRKLSFSLFLNDRSRYEGGEFIVEGQALPNEQREAGTAIVFPGYVQHEVTPITSGRRLSLVGWYDGPLWR